MRTALRQFIAIACLLAAGLAAPHAQTLTHPARPAGVPATDIVTPFGYFHPDCVVHLAAGDALLHDRKLIRHANGTATPMQACTHPHYRANGERVFGDERAIDHPDISYAYVELVSTTTTTSYGSLSAQWTVPATPASNDGQTIYIFPGLEDINDVVTIIQPVLGWNSDYASAWGIASWNCCEQGTTYEAPPQKVTAGDTIFGTMDSTCPAGTLTCASWNVVTRDLRTGKSSSLLNTSNFGQTFNWAFAGALEVYSVTQCSDYPTTSAYVGGNTISMNNLRLLDNNLAQITAPAWKVSKTQKSLDPQCNYGGSVPKQVILNN